jgi:hypothetical protein
MMNPRVRKLGVTAHVAFSVGWLGADAGFLVLAIVGLISQEVQMVQSAYLAMDLIGWFVIVPFSFSALLTGLLLALGTPWGLLRHYWIVTKFLLTTAAIIVLLVHTRAMHTGGMLRSSACRDWRKPPSTKSSTASLGSYLKLAVSR